MFTGEDSEEEEDPDMEAIPMQGEDGQHYVVLEVIQLPDDGNGGGHGVVQIAGGGEDYGHQMTTQDITIHSSILDLKTDETNVQQKPLNQEDNRLRREQERANCFGFDDEENLD